MKHYKLIIIGAGAAGLATACFSSFKKHEVCIIDKMSAPAKKLLISGTGQCNITNAIEIKEFLNKYGDQRKFVKHALYHFKNTDLIKFLEDLNVDCITTPNNKVFPKSLKSKDILNALLKRCEDKSVDIHYNQKINSIGKNSELFHLYTDSHSYTCNNLVISTGGKSYPKTGSTGDGYSYAQMLGHSIIPPKPALTPIIIKNYNLSNCAGISIPNAYFSHYINNKKQAKFKGDILFTHNGLSGPGILDNSRYLNKGDVLKLCLIDENKEYFEKNLIELLNGTRKLLKNIFSQWEIPERLLLSIFELCNIDKAKYSADLTKSERKLLLDHLFELNFEIQELGGYKVAMATSGGIPTSEVNSKTMESRISSNLYFAGEVLDVDGNTGGFNLQFAFSSASLLSSKLEAQ